MELVLDDGLWENFLDSRGYTLVGHVDSGSFSDVYAVRKKSSGRTLAVKRMVARRAIHTDPRVTAEITCLKELGMRGAYVIGLDEAVVLERVACLFLELATFGNLETYAQQNWPLSERLVVCAVQQLLSALACCHRLGIAHRDVNPANVLLVARDCVRLADFGLAVRGRDPETGNPLPCDDYLGREAYLAPEVLRRAPYWPQEADLWSMGCLCYFLLTGQHLRLSRAFICGQDNPETFADCQQDDGQCSNVVLDNASRLASIRDCSNRSTARNKNVTSCPRASALLLRHVLPANHLEASFTGLDLAVVDLLDRLCVFEPSQRLNAEDALLYWETRQNSCAS